MSLKKSMIYLLFVVLSSVTLMSTTFDSYAAADDDSENFLTRWSWKLLSSHPQYHLAGAPAQSGSCFTELLRFKPDHTVRRSCRNGASQVGEWRMSISGAASRTLTIETSPGVELNYRVYYGTHNKPTLDLVDARSTKLGSKMVFTYQSR